MQLAAANALDLTLRVRNCRADVRVMRNVGLTYETYDQENRGLYATIRHFSQPIAAASLASTAAAGDKLDGGRAVDGKLLSQSEMCFRLHKSRLRTDKKDFSSGQLLSQATFYFPDVQAAGTMKTRVNHMSSAPAHALDAGAPATAAAPGAGEPNRPEFVRSSCFFVHTITPPHLPRLQIVEPACGCWRQAGRWVYLACVL